MATMVDDDEASQEISLLIEICSSWNLPKPNKLRNLDPYVNVYHVASGRQLHKTDPVKATSEPVWTILTKSLVLVRMSRAALYQTSQLESERNGLKFEVKDHDTIGKNPVIGVVFVSAQDLLNYSTERPSERIELPVDTSMGNVSVAAMTRLKKQKSRASLVFGKDFIGPILALRFRYATMQEEAFMEKYVSNTSVPKNYFEKLESGQSLKSSFSSIGENWKKAKKDKATGEKMLKVQPCPDPDNTENTKWMTKQDIQRVAMKPSKNWLEAGSGNTGYLFVEVIGCDNLDKKDTLGKSDPFVCLVFEDTAVTTDLIENTLNPRWMPWSKRAFAFRADHPSSILYLGVFDSDVGHQYDFIGHVEINPSKFAAGTEYLLHYNLFGSTQHYIVKPDPKKPSGKISLRFHVEYTPKAYTKTLQIPKSFLINTTNRGAKKLIKMTCEGDDVTPMSFDQDIFFGCLSKLSETASKSYELTHCLKEIFLWRGTLTLWIPKWNRKNKDGEASPLITTSTSREDDLSRIPIKIWAPINSAIAFLWAIYIVENPFLILAFLCFVLPWCLVAQYFSLNENPNPWNQPRSLREIVFSATGRKLPQRILQYQSVKETEIYEKQCRETNENRKKEMQESYERSKMVSEQQMIADEVIGDEEDDFVSKKLVSLNPLNKALFPYQQMLCGVVDYIRFISNIFRWELPYVCIMASAIALLLSFIFIVISPFLPIITLWLFRTVVWIGLGPWIKLVDIFFIVPYERLSAEEKMAKSLESQSALLLNIVSNRRVAREDKLKLRDMLSYNFGNHISRVPGVLQFKANSKPLPNSSSEPLEERNDKFAMKIQGGQYLEGTMIHHEMKNEQHDLNAVRHAMCASSIKEHVDIDNLYTEAADMGIYRGAILNINLVGYKLKNTEGMFSKSDPFYEIIASTTSSDNFEGKRVYKSEIVKNNLNPHWQTASIDVYEICKGDLESKLRIDVYDFESNGKHILMGSAFASITSLIASQVCSDTDLSKAFQLSKLDSSKTSGSLIVTLANLSSLTPEASELLNVAMKKVAKVETSEVNNGGNVITKKVAKVETSEVNNGAKNYSRQSNRFSFQIVGYKLKNIEGPFQKSDPFFEIHALDENIGHVSALLYRSSYIANNLNPRWESVSLDMKQLCNNDRRKMFRISVYDYEGDGKHDLMGFVDTNINNMIQAQVDSVNDPSKALRIAINKKNGGRLIVIAAHTQNKQEVENIEATLSEVLQVESINSVPVDKTSTMTESPVELCIDEKSREEVEIIIDSNHSMEYAYTKSDEPEKTTNIQYFTETSAEEGVTNITSMTVISNCSNNPTKFSLQLIGYKLKNIEGPFQKSDPFFELYALHEADKSMKLVYRSVYIPNNLNPWWEPVSVDIDALCEGKRNKVFRILVFDHESDGKHDLMGDVDVTIDQLLAARVSIQKSSEERDASKAIHISKEKKRKKSLGQLLVVDTGTKLL